MNRVSSIVAVAGSLLLLASASVAYSAPGEEPVADSQISDQVAAELRRADAGLVRRLEVTTKDGVVTLNGQARSVQAAVRAVEMAKKVPGVTKVENRLTVPH